jgi:hypothetical protein
MALDSSNGIMLELYGGKSVNPAPTDCYGYKKWDNDRKLGYNQLSQPATDKIYEYSTTTASTTDNETLQSLLYCMNEQLMYNKIIVMLLLFLIIIKISNK